MSIKLLIEVEREPVFTDLTRSFELHKRPTNEPHLQWSDQNKRWESMDHGLLTMYRNRRFYFEDEFFDGNLGRVLYKGKPDEPGGEFSFWRVFAFEQDLKERRRFLLSLSELDNGTIETSIAYRWYRPNLFWKMYKILAKDFLKAKRDLLASLMEAGVVNIYVLSRYVPNDELHPKKKKE